MDRDPYYGDIYGEDAPDLGSCDEDGCCVCETSGDTKWVDEMCGVGIVWNCCRCGAGHVVYSEDLTNEFYEEQTISESAEAWAWLERGG